MVILVTRRWEDNGGKPSDENDNKKTVMDGGAAVEQDKNTLDGMKAERTKRDGVCATSVEGAVTN